MFEEAGKVIQHPRCVNCHPAGDGPLQGMDMHPHQPPVVARRRRHRRARHDVHAPATGRANVDVVAQAETLKSIPGNPALAPRADRDGVGRASRSAEICEQIKDPERNGGKTLAEIVEHMAHDELVGWGWNPGNGREPVPGTQDEFGALFQAWADTGAHCPGG